MTIDDTSTSLSDPCPDTTDKDTLRIDYLLECFRSAREELLLRFKYRENWLQLQLLSQVVLFALAQGVEIAGVKTVSSMPDVVAFSTAISLVFASLYYIDDSLISYIGNYIGALTEAEAKLRPGKWLILNWDTSKQVKHYVQNALPIRYLAQMTAFMAIPIGLVVWRASNFVVWSSPQISEIIIHIVFLTMIGFVILRGFLRRRDSYLRSRPSVLISIEQIDH